MSLRAQRAWQSRFEIASSLSLLAKTTKDNANYNMVLSIIGWVCKSIMELENEKKLPPIRVLIQFGQVRPKFLCQVSGQKGLSGLFSFSGLFGLFGLFRLFLPLFHLVYFVSSLEIHFRIYFENFLKSSRSPRLSKSLAASNSFGK